MRVQEVGKSFAVSYISTDHMIAEQPNQRIIQSPNHPTINSPIKLNAQSQSQ